jgi:hypothetical protein
MTRKAAFVTFVAVLLLGTARPVSADFVVDFPDGNQSFDIDLGEGVHLAAFWDKAGDFDIFTWQGDAVSDPVAVSILGAPAAFAYFLQFQGTTPSGGLVFNMFADQGGGFFFVGQVVL